jgi:NADH dehydrogenase
MTQRPHVVVIGAGFGGLGAAKQLAHTPVDVTIVDQRNYHTFQPLLYQVATAGLNAADVGYPVRGIFHGQPNVSFRHARVTGVDWARSLVELDGDEPLPFDYLVVGAGAVTHYFGIPGASDYGYPLYTLDDAIALRNHILECFEAADADPSLVDDGVLTFVVVGGGPTGVEVAGALAELFTNVLRKDFPRLDVSRARVVLVEMGDRLLAPFTPASAAHAAEILGDRGVEVWTGETVASVEPARVTLASGREISAQTLIWAAGVQANPLAAGLGLETTKSGRIVVDVTERVVGHDNVFAVGDVAAIVDRRHNEALPMLAPVAMQSGKHAAKEIAAAVAGSHLQRPFHYRDKGTMATIGRRAAVAELPFGIRLWGTPAWFAWLGLHLLFLAGFRNRLSVFLNWTWNYFTWDRGPRLIIGSRAEPARRPAALSSTPREDPTTPR